MKIEVSFTDPMINGIKNAKAGSWTLFLSAWLSTFSCTLVSYSSAAEVAACNSEAATNIILNATFAKAKSASLKFIQSGRQTERSKEFANIIQNWTAEIQNIRQNRYDSENNIRYCEGTFVYINMPPQPFLIALFTEPPLLLLWDRSCRGEVQYRVQPLLDQPEQFNVSWRCL